jgi:fatty acid desaturase
MFLSYFSLVVLLIGLMLVFYTFIYIHDIPYEIAKKRGHSQAEAIHVACWLSLFTLHAIWPIVYIWAIAKPRPLSVAIESGGLHATDDTTLAQIAALEERIRTLESGKAGTAATTTTTGGTTV